MPVVVAAVLLLVSAVVLWVWMTIPPAPDPGALPSRVLAPRVPRHRTKEWSRERSVQKSSIKQHTNGERLSSQQLSA